MKLTPFNPYFRTGMLIILILILVGCSSSAAEPTAIPTTAPPVKVVVSGSGGTSALLKYLAEVYRQEHTNWTFEFLSGAGTGGGVKGTLDGTLDLGAMARPPKEEELAQGLKYIHFATERVVFVTSQDISVNKLTTQQLKDIFGGKLTNWSELGGPDETINVLARDEEESNTQILREALFGEMPFTSGAAVFTSEGDLRKALASTRNAIAYASYGGIRLEKVPANAVVIDGLDPANLSHNYPYSKPAGVAYIQANEAKVKAFLDFITSEQARTLLTEQSIIAPSQ